MLFGFLLPTSLFLRNVLANTEIINFRVLGPSTQVVSSHNLLLTLNSSCNDIQGTILPAPLGTPIQDVCKHHNYKGDLLSCPHELWTVLDLDDRWHSYSSFTLRLSWLASHPTDFSIHIYDVEQVSAHLGLVLQAEAFPPRRVKYACIQAIDTGVRPSHLPSHSNLPRSSSTPVPFILILEPLYFGILPRSILPVLAYLALTSIVAWVAAPKINNHFANLATQAKQELTVKAKVQ